MNVRFNLKDAKNLNKETLIYLVFRFNQNKLKYSTGQKIKPKFWNSTQQRAKNKSQFPQAPELNSFLDNLANTTLNTYRKYINDGVLPQKIDFSNELNKITFRSNGSNDEEQPKTFFKFYEQLIEERKENPQFSKETIKTYKTSLNKLMDYKSQKRVELDFDNIDIRFFNDYTNHLFSKNYSTNYVSKLIRNIKTVLLEATERGINKNLAFKSKKFRVSEKETKNIYLTKDELDVLCKLDLRKNERLEKVRDLFLVGCFTGLRFSDFMNIKPEHIKEVDGVRLIDIFTQKTKEAVTIPIHPIVENIFNKYKNKDSILPKTISNQKMNQYLKELGELAEINEEVINVTFQGGRREEEVLRKYEMISTHTARRSFATNAFKSGVSSISIMRITGHKTQHSFMKYIKVTNEENALLMAKNKFFQY